MEICVYDMKYGESILLTDKNHNRILIDCGSLENERKMKLQYENIKKDVIQHKTDILITHFHIDHISGLIYFAKNNSQLFDTLYIPDIYNLKNRRKVISILLLDFLLQQSKLSSAKDSMSLYDLAVGLCSSSEKISFLKSGDTFHNYKVLAPFEKEIERTANVIYKSLLSNIGQNDYWTNICDLFCNALKSKAENAENAEINSLYNLKIIEQEFKNTIINDINISDNIYQPINKFGHLINIVFHSDNCNGNQILFTGDADKTTLNKIHKHKLFYDNYKIYKIPHHGTEAHKFTKICADLSIISNGLSQKTQVHPICRSYCEKEKLCCTNCNNCSVFSENHSERRFCKSRHNILVFPLDKRTIKF